MRMVRSVWASVFVWLLGMSVHVLAETDPFVFEIATEPKKVGDIKPAFIVYKDKKVPFVKVESVLKRYIKLFETATSPDVRVDALNRINNIRAKYGLSSKKLTIDKVKQSEAVLDSYNKIVDSGIFYQRMDELLYQTAKATSFIGNKEESIKRLKLLVGLYPRSKLFDESQFRIAESYFDLGKFTDAADEYKKILAFSHSDIFHRESKFKLAWSLFRLNQFNNAGKRIYETLAYYPELKNQVDMSVLDEAKIDFVNDTFRLQSILASKQKGVETIEALQQEQNESGYAYLSYDNLFRFYLAGDRFKNAAEVSKSYSLKYTDDFYAYRMANNAIRAYQAGEFSIPEWQEKEYFVSTYGAKSPFWSRLNEAQLEEIKPFVLSYLQELAHLYYVRMQKTKHMAEQPELARRSASYYLELAQTDLSAPANGEYVYLAAEALNTAGDFSEAFKLYERSAYEETDHKHTINAAYAAILTFDQMKTAQKPLDASNRRLRQESIEKYAGKFVEDVKTPVLLNDLANELLQEERYDDAVKTARRVIEHRKAQTPVLYSSWLVDANASFAVQDFRSSEKAYRAALTFNKEKDRVALRERLAASIYKQAEMELDPAKSAELFLKVVDSVPDASIVSQALYDASAKLLSTQNWKVAIATLSAFQYQFPDHELYESSLEKLIFAYMENHEYVSAAEKLLELAELSQDAQKAQSSLFQAAEYYQQAELKHQANELYEKFVARYANNFSLSIEAFDRIVRFKKEEGLDASQQAWQHKLIAYESNHQSKRTDRSAGLAAAAAFDLAERDLDAYQQINLTLPLKASLSAKKELMQKAIKQYELVAQYGIPSLSSAATFKIGQIYRHIAKALMTSDRPTTLDELQLEQYDILLEEQAYPFEEQAMDIFAINTERASEGVFNEWIEKTYQILAEMNPAEFSRELKGIEHASSIF